MNIEDQIAELQRKLLIKKAFTEVTFAFGKGHKSFPEEIKQHVIDELTKHALALASEEQTSPLVTETLFSDEEVGALKLLAKSVLNKKPAANTSNIPLVTVVPLGDARFKFNPEEPQPTRPKGIQKGRLATLDGIPKTLRNTVASGAEISILQSNEEKAYVSDTQGNQFWVPLDDIEFQ